MLSNKQSVQHTPELKNKNTSYSNGIKLLLKIHYMYYFQILDLTFFQLITVISYTVNLQNVIQQQINRHCYLQNKQSYKILI